jgi:VWFA-related protein
MGAAGQSGRSYKLRVDVDLVTVEVVALDRSGKPVRNLKKEDFRLYEDGKQQEILSFDEVRDDSGPPDIPSAVGQDWGSRGKTVLILFDNSSIKPGHLKSARDSAEKFVKRHMSPQDQFAVASYDNSLRILQNFTDNPEKVLKALAQPAIPGATAAGPQLLSPSQIPIRGQRGPVTHGAEISGAAGSVYKSENLLRALNAFNLAVEQLKGQKSILLFSESGFSGQNAIQEAYAKTLRSARRSNVAIYAIDPGGLDSGAVGEIREADVAPQSSAQGSILPSLSSTPDINNPLGASQPPTQQSVLKSLAVESGAAAIFNTNDFDSELDKLSLQLSNFYVLGFQSDNPKHDGAFRKLEIKTDLKNLTLKHRNGYFDRRPLDVLANSSQEESLLAAMASPQRATRIPITFHAYYFYDTPRLARVMISAKISMANVTLRRKSGQLVSDLRVMGVAYAVNDSISARFSEIVPVEVDRGKEQNFRRASIPYRNFFKMRPGKYRLKLAASDEGDNLGSAEQILEIPAFPQSGLTGSSLVVADAVSALSDLIRDIDARLLDESDPLAYPGWQVYPSVENRLPVGSPVAVFFKLYNLIGGTNQQKLMAKARLLGEQGEVLTLPPIPLDENISRTGRTEALVGITLPFKQELPGKYALALEISELVSDQVLNFHTNIEFFKN